MKEEMLEVLDQFNKAIKMGEDSYAIVIEKATDEEFKNLLQKQSAIYEDYLHQVNSEYEKLGVKPSDTPIMQKVMGWTSIQMNTAVDNSDSHISEMLIQGASMGIIECSKILNDNNDLNNDLSGMISDFIKLQKQVTDELIPYLHH